MAGKQSFQIVTDDAESLAWALLQAVRSLADSGWIVENRSLEVTTATAIGFHCKTSTEDVDVSSSIQTDAHLVLDENHQWVYGSSLSESVTDLLDLYLPILGTPAQPSVVVGHLGQSLDSQVATGTGDAIFVTGVENRKHLHRMRALCHAVVVGASTVVSDDPQLTTRDVTGKSPVRVVVDPDSRVPDSARILADKSAPTWLLHKDTNLRPGMHDGAHVQRIGLRARHEGFESAEIVGELSARGLTRIFIEGGGVTVTRFFKAKVLHGLQLAVAPVLIGNGRTAMDLPDAISMQAAHRAPHKIYRMGGDILWDFDLRKTDAMSSVANQADDAGSALNKVNAVERLL